MQSPLPFAFFLMTLTFGCTQPGQNAIPREAGPLRAVPFSEVRIDDPFWSPKLEINRAKTVAACLDRCEETGRINNFAVAGGMVSGKHQGRLYNDSDLYKVIEGAAYTLSLRRDPVLEKRLDGIIAKIAAAQQPDGYLNTYYTLVKPNERWQNIAHGHELYCAGHLFEAAVAYFQATGKRELLTVAQKLADYICSVFGPGKRLDPPGHQEIELALIKLGRILDKPQYLAQARFFVDQRGQASGHKLYGEYSQDHEPVRKMRTVAGHAVRAMYLYCAMTDLVADRDDPAMRRALDCLWADVTEKKMYVTGGVGSSGSNEGFTQPYDLPNDTAYCESCAAIGMALWHQRLFLLTGAGRYADQLERVIYNGLISGVSREGDKYFYTNPLASRGRNRRTPWYSCACCPPNLLRYLAGIGGRIYAHRGNDLFLSLYMGSTTTIPLTGGKVNVTQETRYPWAGKIKIKVEPERAMTFGVNLRIPAWLGGWPRVTYPGKTGAAESLHDGFLRICRRWSPGDEVVLDLPMEVRRTYADKRVKENVGKTALQRGPLVFCLEGVDHGGRVRNLILPRDSSVNARYKPELLGGTIILEGLARMVELERGKETSIPAPMTAIPYHLWENRKPGEMVVWIPETRVGAEVALGEGVGKPYAGLFLSASHLSPFDRLEALADNQIPKNSGDHSIPRFTWWDHKGSKEWVGVDFPAKRKLSRTRVYWFDDRVRGGCRNPESWRLCWWNGTGWMPVKLLPGNSYSTAIDKFHSLEFSPIETTRLRLEVKLQPNFSGGILEWQH